MIVRFDLRRIACSGPQREFVERHPIRIWWKSALGLLLAIGFTASSSADDIDDFVQAQMEKLRIPGLTLAVVQDGTVVKQQAYGLANVEFEVPIQTDTVFLIASITKTFTAAAILSLLEEGKLSLDDSVTKFLPVLPASWAPATIRHCLAHVSGLPDVTDAEGNLVADSRSDVFRELTARPIETPGERVVYNQTGYVILGMIIEEVSGLEFKDFIDDRLLRPLGLRNTSFGDRRDVVPGRSSMYTIFEPSLDRMSTLRGEPGPDDPFEGWVVSPKAIYKANDYVYASFMHPAAGMNSTIEDMVQWEVALASGTVLGAATLEQAATPFELNNGESGRFGLGWIVGSRNGHRTMEMGGGWATRHLRFPDDNLSVIVLTNLQGGEQGALAMGVASFFSPDLKLEL